MSAAPLITDPAGDADIHVKRHIVGQFLGRAGKAVHHHPGEFIEAWFEDFEKILMRIALMQKDRHPGLDGQVQLGCESLLLRCNR